MQDDSELDQRRALYSSKIYKSNLDGAGHFDLGLVLRTERVILVDSFGPICHDSRGFLGSVLKKHGRLETKAFKHKVNYQGSKKSFLEARLRTQKPSNTPLKPLEKHVFLPPDRAFFFPTVPGCVDLVARHRKCLGPDPED